MKAQPKKMADGGLVDCSPEEATHLYFLTPGPYYTRILPVITKGTRRGTPNWTWNGDTEKPTLRPSVLTRAPRMLTDEEADRAVAGEKIVTEEVVCHSWITDGQIIFLDDCTHKFAGKTMDLLDVD